MRITSGSLKGRKLVSPGVRNLRLTEAKVRKAIFDILADSIEGSSVLELFAGSGALGIEAFSRGAGEVTFVDNNPRCIETIRENIPQEFREKSYIIEHHWVDDLDNAALDKLQLISRKRYGDTGLTLLRFRAL